MAAPDVLQRLRLPVFGAPMFIVSGLELVIAQCRAGVLGAFPALNARPAEQLDEWLWRLRESLSEADAPYAVNLIVHGTNKRLEQDLALVVKHKAPVVITSLGARREVCEAVHSYGGLVFHDVTTTAFAHKAVEKGADGLVLVAAGAGGHGGRVSPFALVQETRAWFSGPIALAGAIAHGRSIRAARVMGADFAYIGTPFIAAAEANASAEYKEEVLASFSSDIVYTDLFSGILGNYLAGSIKRAGYDPDNLPPRLGAVDVDNGVKVWRDIWAAGQGVGGVRELETAAAMTARWMREYEAAR
ncbi:MAG: nitronate monooxygenase family protein [Hyphomonadaceae bacterium]|nr:nitronate monooxygenase family protein [Hyphomonadaceae bacterium]